MRISVSHVFLGTVTSTFIVLQAIAKESVGHSLLSSKGYLLVMRQKQQKSMLHEFGPVIDDKVMKKTAFKGCLCPKIATLLLT